MKIEQEALENREVQLTVEVSDGSAASRLRLEQGKIKAALDERLGRGEVAQIKLKVGRPKDWSSQR